MPEPLELNHAAIKAVAHPMRQRIITILYAGVRSPKELAAALREPLANVVHHVRVLEQLGAVEVAETIEHKGTIERRYRLLEHLWLRDVDVAALPEVARRSISGAIFDAIQRDVAAAMAARTFDARPEAHISRTWLELDEQGWHEVTAVLSDALDRVVDIRDAARARLADDGSWRAAIRSEVAILHFERATEGDGERRM